MLPHAVYCLAEYVSAGSTSSNYVLTDNPVTVDGVLAECSMCNPQCMYFIR